MFTTGLSTHILIFLRSITVKQFTLHCSSPAQIKTSSSTVWIDCVTSVAVWDPAADCSRDPPAYHIRVVWAGRKHRDKVLSSKSMRVILQMHKGPRASFLADHASSSINQFTKVKALCFQFAASLLWYVENGFLRGCIQFRKWYSIFLPIRQSGIFSDAADDGNVVKCPMTLRPYFPEPYSLTN